MLLNFFTSNADTGIVSDSALPEIVSTSDAVDTGNFLEIIKNADPGRFVEMLPKLAMGMVSIFIVIGVIIIATSLLNKIFSKKKEKAE